MASTKLARLRQVNAMLRICMIVAAIIATGVLANTSQFSNQSDFYADGLGPVMATIGFASVRESFS